MKAGKLQQRATARAKWRQKEIPIIEKPSGSVLRHEFSVTYKCSDLLVKDSLELEYWIKYELRQRSIIVNGLQ